MSELRNSLIRGLGPSGLKRARRHRKRIRHKIDEHGIGHKPLLIKVATMDNRHYQDTMISVQLYGYSAQGAQIKLGEQYFADQLERPRCRGISLLCASVVHKWMLHDYDYKVEIFGYSDQFDKSLLVKLINVFAINVEGSLPSKQAKKFKQLMFDCGDELRENTLPLIDDAIALLSK